ncbi:50S ribosomal protein L1 [candidate division KSB1 bacterium]
MKKSKRFIGIKENCDKQKELSLEEGLDLLGKSATAKFDETVEISMNLGVDPRHADQNIRGVVSLPHGTGKTKKVLVLTKGSKEDEAKEAGADHVGLDDYIKKIQDGWADVDSVVATPDVMGQVGKLGKLLGPRGLMPSPKSGTVTMDVADAVKAIKAGKIEFRVDKTGIIHTGLGKASFGTEKLSENIKTFLAVVVKLKPASTKGQYIKKMVISSSMGPGIKLNHQEILQNL